MLFALGDGLGVGAAAGMAALAALGLRQQGVDLLDDGVAFHFEFLGGVAEHGAEQRRQPEQGGDGDQYRGHNLINPEKPMNARDISPAVIRPMLGPRKASGTSATAIRSRMAANRISTSEKPRAAPRP